jgi:hypothetical protein
VVSGVRLGWQGSPADLQKGTITMTPEYGAEKQDREDWPDREIEPRDLGERELEDLNPEDNEAHAPGQVCARCGAVITAGQDVRLQADDRWVHEVCPVDLGELPEESAG